MPHETTPRPLPKVASSGFAFIAFRGTRGKGAHRQRRKAGRFGSPARWAPACGSWRLGLRERGWLGGWGTAGVRPESACGGYRGKARPRGELFPFTAATPTHAGCLLACKAPKGSWPLWHVVWCGGPVAAWAMFRSRIRSFRKSARFPRIPRAPPNAINASHGISLATRVLPRMRKCPKDFMPAARQSGITRRSHLIPPETRRACLPRRGTGGGSRRGPRDRSPWTGQPRCCRHRPLPFPWGR